MGIRYVLLLLISVTILSFALQAQDCGSSNFTLQVVTIQNEVKVEIRACAHVYSVDLWLKYTGDATYSHVTEGVPDWMLCSGEACVELTTENYVRFQDGGASANLGPCAITDSLIVTFHFNLPNGGSATFKIDTAAGSTNSTYVDGGSNNHEICTSMGSGSGMVLSLELLAFKADLINNKEARLVWRTTEEVNSSHFDIERTLDGVHWTNIGRTPAASDMEMYHDYTFVDRDIGM
jgi:hypothetical protein